MVKSKDIRYSLVRCHLPVWMLLVLLQSSAYGQEPTEQSDRTKTHLTQVQREFDTSEIEIISTAMWRGPQDIAVVDSTVFMVMGYGLQVMSFEELAVEGPPRQYFMPDLHRVAVASSLLFMASRSQLSCHRRSGGQFDELPLDTVEVGGNIVHMKVLGDHVYLLTLTDLTVVNFQDPSELVVVAHTPVTFNKVFGVDLEVTPEAVYIAALDLQIITGLFSGTPGVFRTDPIRHARSVSVTGNILWLLTVPNSSPARECDFEAYDITNPDDPRRLSRTTVLGEIHSIHAVRDTLYVAGGETGVAIFDISEPKQPHPVHCLEPFGYASGVLAQEGLLFVRNTPPMPEDFCYWTRSLCRPYGDDSTPVSLPAKLRMCDFAVFDVNQQSEPVLVGRYEHPGNPMKLHRQDDEVWVFSDLDGIRMLTLREDGSIEQGPMLETSRGTEALYAEGDLVMVAQGYPEGVSIFDLADRSNPQLVSFSPGRSYYAGVSIVGTTAYVSASSGGLHTLDISDPSEPRTLQNTATAGWAPSVLLGDSLLFVSGGASHTKVYDCRNPDSLRLVSVLSGDGEGMWAIQMAVQEGLFAAAGGSNVYLVDISSLSEPRLLCHAIANSVDDIALKDSLLFLAQNRKGINIIDISDPSNPQSLGIYNTPGAAHSLEVYGDELLVADGSGFLRVRINIETGQQ